MSKLTVGDVVSVVQNKEFFTVNYNEAVVDGIVGNRIKILVSSRNGKYKESYTINDSSAEITVLKKAPVKVPYDVLLTIRELLNTGADDMAFKAIDDLIEGR